MLENIKVGASGEIVASEGVTVIKPPPKKMEKSKGRWEMLVGASRNSTSEGNKNSNHHQNKWRKSKSVGKMLM